MIYLDNSATTRVLPAAARAASEAMELVYANPSSLHRAGLEAEHIVSRARRILAGALGAQEEEIIFTGGATESNNTAVFGVARARRRLGGRVVTTAVEHPSVARCFDALAGEGFEVVRIAPRNGRWCEEDIFDAVNSDTVLVSMMAVNNETGDILPLAAARRAIDSAGAPALLHCDAVQAFGKLPLDPHRAGLDLVSVSGHKLYAPKGVGALYIAKGVRILPLLLGGGQERGLRSGTENVPGIAAFGAAVGQVFGDFEAIGAHYAALRRHLLERLAGMDGICVNSPETGAAHIINISVPGARSETLLHILEEAEIYVSSGSACSAKSKKASGVLAAYGLDAVRADSALRISLCPDNTECELDAFCDALAAARSRLVRPARR